MSIEDKLINALYNGSNFCIWATVKGYELVSKPVIIYKINGEFIPEDDSVVITSRVLQKGIFIEVYKCIITICANVLETDVLKYLENARNSAMDVIAFQTFYANFNIVDEDKQPREYIHDLIEEYLIIEDDTICEHLQMPSNKICVEREFHIKSLSDSARMQFELNKLFKYMIDYGKKYIENKELFMIDIDWNTNIFDGESVNAHTIFDTILAFNGVFMGGSLSYFGDNQRLVNDKDPVLKYISKDANELIEILQDAVYSLINFLYKITSSSVNITVKISLKD